MSISVHYNYFQFQRVLCEVFQCNVKWSQINTLIFEYNGAKLIMTKNNKMSSEYVEACVIKLGLTMQQFTDGYDKLFHA